VVSLARALVQIGKAKGGIAYLPDALQVEVFARVPEEDRAYWHMASPRMRMTGLIAYEPALKKLCRQEGVMVWLADPASSADDRRTMIVNTEWCDTPEKKLEHINRPSNGGRGCRFCGIVERDHHAELVEVGTNRGPTSIVNEIPVLRPGAVYVHGDVLSAENVVIERHCQSEWLRWVDIATRFVREGAAVSNQSTKPAKPRRKRAA
jgi:hypothetical protein